MLRARKLRQRRDLIVGIIGILVFLLSAAYVGAWFVRQSAGGSLDARNCPESGTIGVSAIVLDATDRLDRVTRQDLERRLAGYLENDVAFGQGVQVWRVSAAQSRSDEPPVICRPVIPDQAFTANPRLAEKRHRELYFEPIMAAISDALSAPEESTSPILETLQEVVITSRSVGSRRMRLNHVVLASDLAQHTTVSLELGTADFDRFRRSPEFLALNPGEMDGVAFLALQIQRRRHVGRADSFAAFWRSLVESQGGRFTVEPLRGLS